MPIKDAVLFRKPPEFRRAGTIRLGIKVDSGRVKDGKPIMLPQEVDYFVLPPDLRERHAELGLDEQPKELAVAFPSDNLEEVFPMSIQAYGGKFLKFVCDGETAKALGQDGSERSEACRINPEGHCLCEAAPTKAKALGRLNVIVATAKHTDIYQVIIGGLRRNANLKAEIIKAQKILGKGGLALSASWFKLARERRDVQVKTEGGRTIQHGYPVHCILEVEPTLVMSRMLGAGPAAPRQVTAGSPTLGFCPQCQGPRPCPVHEEDPGSLDFSTCLAKGIELLKVSKEAYETYACLAFQVADPSDLSLDQLVELTRALEIAMHNEQARIILRQTVMLTISKAKKERSV